MTEVTGAVLFSTVRWPADALRERCLLVIESYEPCDWRLPDSTEENLESFLIERGFERLRRGSWTFPYLEDHLISIDEETDAFALIDEAADELFAYPHQCHPAWLVFTSDPGAQLSGHNRRKSEHRHRGSRWR